MRVVVSKVNLVTTTLVNKALDSAKLQTGIGLRIGETITRHAKNAFAQVGATLDSGMPGGVNSGARTLSARDGEGKRVQVTTVPFAALTKKYVASSPRSVRMWRKRGKLAHNYARDVSEDKVVVSVHEAPAGRSHHKNKRRYRYDLELERNFNPVITRLIAAPFMTGDETQGTGLRAYRLPRIRSSKLLGYPEAGPYARPFVSRLAAKLGQRAHTAIRRL